MNNALRAGLVCLAVLLVVGKSAAQEPNSLQVARSSNKAMGPVQDGLALSLSPPQQPIYPDGTASITIELRNVSKGPKRVYVRDELGRKNADPYAVYAFRVVNRETGAVVPFNRSAASELGADIIFPMTTHDLPSGMSAYARSFQITWYYPIGDDGTYLVAASTWVGTGRKGVWLRSNTVTITVRGLKARGA